MSDSGGNAQSELMAQVNAGFAPQRPQPALVPQMVNGAHFFCFADSHVLSEGPERLQVTGGPVGSDRA
jgi:hypothetical protein